MMLICVYSTLTITVGSYSQGIMWLKTSDVIHKEHEITSHVLNISRSQYTARELICAVLFSATGSPMSGLLQLPSDSLDNEELWHTLQAVHMSS